MKTKEEVLAESCQLISEIDIIKKKFELLVQDCPEGEEWAEMFKLYTNDITIKSLSAVIRRHDGILVRYVTPEAEKACPITGATE